jgi:YfiH family protein
MGRKRGSGKAGRRVSEAAERAGASGAPRAPSFSSEIREVPIPGPVPRFEIPGWRESYGVIAGITGRGSEPGRGFDLGLWSREPVGEVMSRWLTFRREMKEFHVIALGNQVHGTELMRLDTGRGWVYMDGIDGWITTAAGVLLTVTVADCVPVYLVAPGLGVALLHAGWRGVAGGILGRGIKQLTMATNSVPDDFIMHCGIGICGSCYEVGSEVMQTCGVPAAGSGPWQLDLRERLTEQGRTLGLTRITTSPWCSAHDRPTFFSHRGSYGVDGRMVAYLGSLASNPPLT